MDDSHRNGASTSLWLLVGWFAVLPAIWLCYVVLRWGHFLEKAIDTMMGNRRSGLFRISQDPSTMFLVDTNKLCVGITIGWCLFCALPVWMVLTNCTDLPLQKIITDLFRYLREA